MANHVTKMEDGHFIVETEEEHQKRKESERKFGCIFWTIVAIITIIVVIIIGLGGGFENEKNTSTKQSTQSSTINVQKEKSKATSSSMEESIKNGNSQMTNPSSKMESSQKETSVTTKKEAGNKGNVSNDSENIGGQSMDLNAAKKLVDRYFQNGQKAIADNNLEMAKQYLDAMIATQSSLDKQIPSIDKKIEKLKKDISKHKSI